MRLLMTADAVGGVWTYAMELTRELSARGHEVVLATMGPRPSPEQRAEATHVHLVESDHRLEWMHDPDVDAAGRWLLRLEDQHRPDVVHLNGYAHAALPWRAPTLVVAHSCVRTWWRACLGEDAPAEYDAYRERVERGLKSAGLVAAPTRALLDAMREHYAVPSGALVIPNGVDPRRYHRAPKEGFVLAVGRAWDKAKDMRTLDQAAARLPFPVRVVGDARGPDGDAAPPLRHAFPLGRLPADRLVDQYARAAVLAHPARYEPFGLAPVEAALSGCALVLADLPTLREVWGDAARYAPTGDAAAIHRVLDEVLRDRARRLDLATRARERALRYSARAMADAYLAAYARLSPSAFTEGPPCAS